MANIKSAGKRARQSLKRRAANRAVKSRIGTVRGRALEAVAKGDKETAAKMLSLYSSTLDKAAKKGVIKPNTADRRKARFARRLRAMA
jgi:small subunit ribosomal protein S20